MTRRLLRESIFKILFRYEFNGAGEMDEQLEFAMADETDIADDKDEITVDPSARKKDKEYIINKVKAILEHIDVIDEIIASVSDGWKLQRIGKAELAIMRLAVYEIRFDDDVPYKVAINEALELTKIYCNEDAKGFVNALLSKVGE